MLGGLDWTGTALGRAFKAQEQVLFMFAAIIFIISVILHMFSIPEKPFVPPSQLRVTGSGESTSHLSFRAVSHTPPLLNIISEEDTSVHFSREDESDAEGGGMDFLAVGRVRSKSDSLLAMPEATIELDPDLDAQLFLPGFQEDLEDAFKPSEPSVGSSSPYGGLPDCTDGHMVSGHSNKALPKLTGLMDAPSSATQMSSGSENTNLKTQVNYTVLLVTNVS